MAATANVTPEDLAAADEAFISSSAGGVIPVTVVNSRPVNRGEPGLVSCRLRDLYWKKREEGWRSTSVDELLVKPVHVLPAS